MKHTFVTIAALLMPFLAVVPALAHEPPDKPTSPVFSLADGTAIDGAWARLNRTDSGVGYNLHSSELVEGHAVTVWWVIFNNPDACATDPCGVADLFVDLENGDFTPKPDVNPAVQSGGGHVVDDDPATFAGHLVEGQVTTEHPLFVGGPGLTNARGAEIHLVVRSHGPVVEEHMPSMIRSFEGGCEVELTPGIQPEHEGECADLQFAVFT